MEAPNVDFNLGRLERVISGPGKAAALGKELERRGLKRAVVVTGKTLGSSRLLNKITDALGQRCAAVFNRARQHVPRSTTLELQAEIERVNADCLVSFGGGSPIDTAKVAIHALLSGRELVHIAVPTTLSAGEYTQGAGVTDETTLVKSGVADPRIQPRVVINDPTLSLETPEWLWAATGMRALDHAVESAYAVRHHPLSDTLAAKAISLLVEHLAASLQTTGEDQLAHRGHCQMAAWFSIFGAATTRFGLSHALGHQIGPRWNVAHGITSCITLPYAMRFMAEIAPERFGPIAQGFGLPFAPENPKAGALACADRVAKFIAGFDVPHTLKEAGVSRNEFGQITAPVAHELEHARPPESKDRPITQGDIAALLVAAY